MIVFNLTSGGQVIEEPFPDELKSVTMGAEEYLTLKAEIAQLKAPWIRNANKDREMRPARSTAGYRLVSVKSDEKDKKQVFRIEMESPYMTNSFDFTVALEMMRQDMPLIGEALGYPNVLLNTSKAVKPNTMFQIRLIADERNEFYHVQALANAAPERRLGLI